MMGHDGVHQQRGEHDHLGQLGAGHAHQQQVRHVVLQTGRPPEEVSGSENVHGYEEVSGSDDGSRNEDKDVYDKITQKSSGRTRYQHKLSVLEG